MKIMQVLLIFSWMKMRELGISVVLVEILSSFTDVSDVRSRQDATERLL